MAASFEAIALGDALKWNRTSTSTTSMAQPSNIEAYYQNLTVSHLLSEAHGIYTNISGALRHS